MDGWGKGALGTQTKILSGKIYNWTPKTNKNILINLKLLKVTKKLLKTTKQLKFF